MTRTYGILDPDYARSGIAGPRGLGPSDQRELLCPALISSWAPDGDIGSGYQRWLDRLEEFRWVTFVDHDGEILHRDWYDVLLGAIEKHPDAGMFVAAVNMLKPFNKGQSIGVTQDMTTTSRLKLAHLQRAVHGATTVELPPTRDKLAAGAFMCLKADAVRDAGGFNTGFAGVDWDIHRKLVTAGYKVYLIPGLLFWHRDRTHEPRESRGGLPGMGT